MDGIVREMQAAVLRTGFSTIIRESHDFSAGITDSRGNVIGQHSPLPPHLGAYPECVRGILQFYSVEEMEPGDCFLINHPYYSGCAHPNDMVVVLPVHYEGSVVAFCASMGHKSDIGGQSPGSRNTLARDVFGEGLQIMPVKFLSKSHPVKEVFQFISANSRTPSLVIGDLSAQAGALASIGAVRLVNLMDQYGHAATLEAFWQLGIRNESRVRSSISHWPDGAEEAFAYVDDIASDGGRIFLHVTAEKHGDRLTLDFSKSGPQSLGPMNVRPPFIHGMAYYAVISMIDPSVPNNFGLARAIECRFGDGSILNPSFPAPVGFYSSTLAAVEDIIFEAISRVAGRPAVAHNASGGMVVLGNVGSSKRSYVQYELLLSGNGAYAGGDGWTGTGHSWTGGAKFTSVEILESEFDVELLRFAVVEDTAGAGEFRGGPGFVREYLVKEPCRYAGGTIRSLEPSHGVNGGHHGTPAELVVNPGSEGATVYKGMVSNLLLNPGDVIRVQTGSGGGVGDPKSREINRVMQDIRNGYISTHSAVEIYGINLSIAQKASNNDAIDPNDGQLTG